MINPWDMKNPKIFLLLCLVSVSSTLFADEFEVLSFRQDDKSLIARVNPRKDINGRPCAVIKVMTDIKDLSFNSNQGIEGDVKYNQGEYWVYVQPGEKQIIIKHPDFKPLYYAIEMSIEPAGDYVMEVRRKKTSAGLDENLVKITFRLNEENTYISRGEGAPVKVSSKVSEYQLPKGEYNFRFSKEGFESKSETILADHDKIIDINLNSGTNTTRFKLPGIIIINSEHNTKTIMTNDVYESLHLLNHNITGN